MLSNTLRRLVFLARSTKRPILNNPIAQATQQSKQQVSEGYSHHLSPTLKKLDKRYNEAMKRSQKEEEEMMKSFGMLREALKKENEEKRLTKEEKKREVEERLRNLEVPENLRERFVKMAAGEVDKGELTREVKGMGKQKEDDDQQGSFDSFSFDNINMQNINIRGSSIKSQQQANSIKQTILKPQDPLAPQKLRQQMLLQQILKQSKSKQASLNLPKDWQSQLKQQQQKRQQQQQLINHQLRYQKLKSLAQPGQLDTSITSNSEMRRLQMLKGQHKIEVTPDDVWRQKYPAEMVEKALQYKNRELGYFKQLVEGDRRDDWDEKRESEMVKTDKEYKEKKRRDREIMKQAVEQSKIHPGTQLTQTQQHGLTRYRDLQYYKQKGLKQFTQTQTLQNYDLQLKQSSESDLTRSLNLSDLYMTQYNDSQQIRLQKKQRYQSSTFHKYQSKLNQLSKKMQELGIEHDFDELRLLSKEQLFADKKIQEENQGYRQYLIKKEKKKQMKEELKMAHKEKLREDLNFDYQLDPVKLERLNPVDMEEGLRKMDEIKRLKETTVVSTEFLKEKIHHTKTFKAMSQFISAYFYNNLQNANNLITQKVQVGNILPNRKNTVLNIFWQFSTAYSKLMTKNQFTPADIQQQKSTLQKILQKQSTYLSSKMCLYLGLRYGPDIRFFFNQKLEETVNSYNEIKKYKDEIVELTIEEYKEKGHIKTKEQEEDYRRKIMVLAENNLEDLNNQKKLVSKGFLKRQRFQKKIQARTKAKQVKRTTKERELYGDADTVKKVMTEKEKSQKVLQQIITKKVQKKKQSIFTPVIEDQQLYFGEKIPDSEQKVVNDVKEKHGLSKSTNNVQGERESKVTKKTTSQRRQKRLPSDRMWQQIEKAL